MACSTTKSLRSSPTPALSAASAGVEHLCGALCRGSGAGRWERWRLQLSQPLENWKQLHAALGGPSRWGKIYKKTLGILEIFVVLSVVHFRQQCLFPQGIISLVFLLGYKVSTNPPTHTHTAPELGVFMGLA